MGSFSNYRTDSSGGLSSITSVSEFAHARHTVKIFKHCSQQPKKKKTVFGLTMCITSLCLVPLELVHVYQPQKQFK